MIESKSFALSSCLSVAGLAVLLTGCATSSHKSVKAPLAPMPEAVTSFGAATAGEWLYVFGGHKGERHDYSVDMVSGSFQRLNLYDGRSWEKLPSARPGQGQPLIAYREYILRTGGMAARNKPDEKQDLYSMSLVQRFNPHTKVWENYPSLPEIRSSHDAVVLGDKLYIAGGWQLAGGTNKAVWPQTALVLDLSKPEAGWKEFSQPFQRRALALAAIGTRIYCIGGMDSNDKPTLAVDVYDTATGQWSKGPDLPPGPVKGFACSAIAQDGRIYANAFKGDLLRLSEDEKSWELVGKLENPRMAHRIVKAGKKQIIALGGEDGEDKRPELEVLTPSLRPLSPEGDKASQQASSQGAGH